MPEFRDFEKEIARLRDKMNRLFAEYPRGMGQSESLDEVEWIPPLDVLEDKDDIIIRADIPGMSPDGIDLSISEDVLHIKGERLREVTRSDENYHVIGRGYGKFDRQVALPTPVEVESIRASYRDGILTVRLPKLEKEKTAEIIVKPE